ncbi:MerR family transcriptional regulator [Oryzifoliimicrobium ureilyticus]|uniref:MerR family transcriptional regulator n=1 Tax=Oryzifoliimicrobium ureilyticus TaxID=3113724 RepID=UPI0030763425
MPTTFTTSKIIAATGISKELLYAWEARYAAVVSTQGATGRRQYEASAVRRIRLLQKLVGKGSKISSVATLKDEELVVALYHQSAPELIELLNLLRTRAFAAFESQVAAFCERLGVLDFTTRIALPLMAEVGEEWEAGKLSVAAEHFATSTLRIYISAELRITPIARRAKTALFTTLSDERHELGILAAALVARYSGWACLYLGPNLQVDEIIDVARHSRPKLITIGLTSEDRGSAQTELERIVDVTAKDAIVCVGGKGARKIKGGARLLVVKSIQEFAALVGTVPASAQ